MFLNFHFLNSELVVDLVRFDSCFDVCFVGMGQARKLLSETLGRLIEKRRRRKEHGGGLLGVLLGGGSDGGDEAEKNKLSDSQIADNIIGVIFAAQDTTASVLTWILKYLHDNHHLLDAVKVKPKSKPNQFLFGFMCYVLI